MNTLILQKRANTLESIIKKASRALLEFEVAQAKWEISQGKGRVFKSSAELKRYIKSKLR